MNTWHEETLELPTGGSTRVHRIDGPAGAPTLILLHGLGATARLNWATSMGALGGRYRVIAFDQRGHGRGVAGTGGSFRLERCADDVVAVANQLGVGRFIPVGYSMGGAVAQLTWRRHPSRVDGLVLCATAGRFAHQRLRRVAHLSGPVVSLAARIAPDSAWQRASEQLLGGPGLSPEARQRLQDEVRASDPVAILEAGIAVAAFDSEPWLARIDVPTAVVLTTEDRHVSPARQQRLVDSIPDSQAFPVVADHIACVRRPELFVPQLLAATQWLDGRVASRTTA
jgi:pimeloyl-ACP methyl ester carboxylesterase